MLRIAAVLPIICLAAAAGAQEQAAPPAPAVAGATERVQQDYILGPGDVIEVRVLGQQDFTTRTRIREDGSIALPFLGNIDVSGRSPVALARDITAQLQRGGYFNKPIVNVEVASYASRYVTVLGAVGASGLVPVDRDYRLSEILARSGGLRTDSSNVVVVRSVGGAEQRYDYTQIASGMPTADPVIRPGDKIFAPVAESFYIYGQVNAPGSYPLRGDLTLRNSLARGGGLTASGSDKKVDVYRNGEKLKLKPEDKIQPDDTIVVRERFF